MNPHYNWLILLVIHDFNEPEFTTVIEDILAEFKAEGCVERNRVLLIHDKIKVTHEGEVSFQTHLQTLELRSDNSDDPLEFFFKDIEEEQVGFKFHDQRGWELLLEWINKEYISKKTILITLSHGAGVGIKGGGSGKPKFSVFKSAKKIIPLKYLHPEVIQFLQKDQKSARHYQLKDGYVLYTKDDKDDLCKKIEMLWMTELADALKKSFRRRKIDILMMSNCYLQTFETGWLLRNQVRYLVAPETVFKAYGYSYKGLLNILNQNTEIHEKKILSTIIPDFITKMSADNIESKHLKMETVVINDLRYYGILKFFFERIAKSLMKSSEKKMTLIIKHRDKIQNSCDYPLNDRFKAESNPTSIEFIDYNHFLSKMNIVFRYNFPFRFFSFLFKTFSKMACLHIYIGEDYIRHDLFINRKFKLQGISIFMPRTLGSSKESYLINCAYFGTSQVSFGDEPSIPLERFVKTSLWDEFIKKYITKLIEGKPIN